MQKIQLLENFAIVEQSLCHILRILGLDLEPIEEYKKRCYLFESHQSEAIPQRLQQK